MKIHPTAIIEPGAQLGRDVEVGAYSYIGPHVVLHDGCRIHHHVTIDGHTTLGEACEIFPQAVLGTKPQDLKYAGERTTLEIGKRNVFREMTTANPGTAFGGGVTRIGDDNFFLMGVHIAHDCIIGNKCIIANYVQFGGHIHVEDCVNMGGHSAVHHFVTIGRYAFVGGFTRVSMDVPPYLVFVGARGNRTEARMVNSVSLLRHGFSAERVAALKAAFLRLYSRRARMSGTSMTERIDELLAADPTREVEELCRAILRSYEQGRHGRYLESLRNDRVRRDTWKPQLELKEAAS